MGQKVDPRGFRTGPTLIKNWGSIMYAKNNYGDLLIQDLKIREFVNKKCAIANIAKVVIERISGKNLIVNIHAKRPGVIIGKSGNDIEKLKKDIIAICGGDVYINIHEVKKPDIDSSLVAQSIASQLEKRIAFRKAMKRAIQSAFKYGAKGIKVAVSGRLGGAEIARTEWYREGRVPLHTLRADVDYATYEAHTTYGVIGIKVWVYKGDASVTRRNKIK